MKQEQDLEKALQIEKKIESYGIDLAMCAQSLKAAVAEGENDLKDDASFASFQRLDAAVVELKKISEQLQMAAQNAKSQTLAKKRKEEERKLEGEGKTKRSERTEENEWDGEIKNSGAVDKKKQTDTKEEKQNGGQGKP